MPDWLIAVIAVIAGFLFLWLGLVIFLLAESRKASDPTTTRDLLRLIPDVVRLTKRLASDPTVPRATRVWLGILLAYLLFPIDLIPDFIPVIGYADDVLITALVLRKATQSAGTEAIERHWPGTPEGLRALKRLVGI